MFPPPSMVLELKSIHDELMKEDKETKEQLEWLTHRFDELMKEDKEIHEEINHKFSYTPEGKHGEKRKMFHKKLIVDRLEDRFSFLPIYDFYLMKMLMSLKLNEKRSIIKH